VRHRNKQIVFSATWTLSVPGTDAVINTYFLLKGIERQTSDATIPQVPIRRLACILDRSAAARQGCDGCIPGCNDCSHVIAAWYPLGFL